MLTTVLDLLGLLLIVAATGFALGFAAAALAAGICCLVTSWRIARTSKR